MKKRAKVHLLPTDKTSTLYQAYGTLRYGAEITPSRDYQPLNLYFTTDDEIKEGDWFMFYGEPRQAKNLIAEPVNQGKIIATTDFESTLPQPSKAFIEEYCRVGGIDEVDVEYDDEWVKVGHSLDVREFPVVNSNNEIIIHPIEEKMYSREEVVQLLMKSLDATVTKHDKFRALFETQLQEWIKENL